MAEHSDVMWQHSLAPDWWSEPKHYGESCLSLINVKISIFIVSNI